MWPGWRTSSTELSPTVRTCKVQFGLAGSAIARVWDGLEGRWFPLEVIDITLA